ncbi:MAG: hypothetical protein IJ518_01965 [Clostridia bacterium]|nr:hypothetical protein [Clostridia bacterium]
MNKKHIAINTHLILCVVLFIVFLGLSISCAIESEIGLSIMFGIFVLLPIFVFAISSLYFSFSDDYVEIVYNFGQREQIKWTDIRSISLMGSWIGAGGGSPHYVIAYPRKDKRLFFVVGEIQKTRKTKKFIEKYYKKKIV